MTLRLVLIRHAKSSWDDFSIEDHDRQLNERGRRSAPAIGQWIADRGDIPTEVLCSDAKRTRETLDQGSKPANGGKDAEAYYEQLEAAVRHE